MNRVRESRSHTPGNRNPQSSKAKLPLQGLLLLFALLVLHVFLTLAVLSEKRYSLSAGDTVPETILSPTEVEDTAATENLRRNARAAVETVLSPDKALTEKLLTGLSDSFDVLWSIREEALIRRTESLPASVEGELYVDTRTYQQILTQEELRAFTDLLPVRISDSALGYALLNAEDSDIRRLSELITGQLSEQLSAGLSEEALESVRASDSRQLQITTLPTRLKAYGELLYDSFLQPTLLPDEGATARMREAAADAVEPVMLQKGAVIAEKGTVLTTAQYTMLTNLGLLKNESSSVPFLIAVVMILVLAYAFFLRQLGLYSPTLLSDGRSMRMLALMLAVSLMTHWGCSYLDPRLNTASFAVLLSAVLLDRETARAVNLLFSVTFALTAGGKGAQIAAFPCFVSLAASLLGGEAAIQMCTGNRHSAFGRGAMVAAGGICGIIGAVFGICACLLTDKSLLYTLISAGLLLLPPVLLSVLAVGSLTMWENAFHLITPARLSELSNTNHPLLKRMMGAAPGTFHHCMMTATLAETAAQDIGANAALAKTAAMYHDVGKLRRPQYFSENQTGHNIHDTMDPLSSASVIISHVADADPLLQKYRIPPAIRQIVAEHHGTTQVAYFLHKAKQNADGTVPDESAFRYRGPRPGSRESAIVMLSDSCEAAVRSLGDATPDRIADMVRKVIRGKLEDGQLSDSGLTVKELLQIEKSFLITFQGILHDRVRYPENNAD